MDRSVFSQLQADHSGIDFMELSANIIRAHQMRHASTPSILDSETTSKGLSPSSTCFSPPSYDDIFGEKPYDLPPSYSEVSLMLRHLDNAEFFPRVFQRQLPRISDSKDDLEGVLVLNDSPRIVHGEVSARSHNLNLSTRSESALDEDSNEEATTTCVPSSRSCSTFVQIPGFDRESTL